jgi:hypothetical protein
MTTIALSSVRRRTGMGAVALVTASPAGPLELEELETQQLTLHAFNASNAELSILQRQILYSTSNAAVATVSTSGLVTGIGEGTCEITGSVDGETVVVDIEVIAEGGGSLLTPLDFSDTQEGGLGTATVNKTDGGKWPILGGIGHAAVDPAGLGFPANAPGVFEVNAHWRSVSATWACIWRKTDLPVLAVGDTRYGRFYVRMDFDERLTGNGDHPWQDGNAQGDANNFIGVHYSTGVNGVDGNPGHWQIGVSILQAGSTIAFDRGPWLELGKVYRVENKIHCIDASTYTYKIRVYDETVSTTVPIYDSADFPRTGGGDNLEDSDPFTWKDRSETAGANAGENDFEMGPSPEGNGDWWTSSDEDFKYGNQGLFAWIDNQTYSGDDTLWVGPYGTCIGEIAA